MVFSAIQTISLTSNSEEGFSIFYFNRCFENFIPIAQVRLELRRSAVSGKGGLVSSVSVGVACNRSALAFAAGATGQYLKCKLEACCCRSRDTNGSHVASLIRPILAHPDHIIIKECAFILLVEQISIRVNA